MPVTISPPLLLELNKNFWDTPYFQEDVVSDPYEIIYTSASSSSLKIDFSTTGSGPLRFCSADADETPIDAPVWIRNGSGVFRFKVKVNYQILNNQTNNITFNGLIKTTEELTEQKPWYKLKFDPRIAVFKNMESETKVMVYLQLMTINNSGDFVVTRTLWPEDEFIVTPVGDAASQVKLKLQSRVSPAGVPLTKLVFEDQRVTAAASYFTEFIVKLAGEYKDQNDQPIEAVLRIQKDVTNVGGGSGQAGQGNWGQGQGDEQTDPPRVM